MARTPTFKVSQISDAIAGIVTVLGIDSIIIFISLVRSNRFKQFISDEYLTVEIVDLRLLSIESNFYIFSFSN